MIAWDIQKQPLCVFEFKNSTYPEQSVRISFVHMQNLHGRQLKPVVLHILNESGNSVYPPKNIKIVEIS